MVHNEQELNWKADETDPDHAEAAREALRQVTDPEIGLNVIELGLIRDLVIDEGRVHITMILTTPFCPYAPAMLEMARQRVEEELKLPTTIEIGSEMWEPSMMEAGAGGDWGLF